MEDPTRDALIAVYPDDGTAQVVADEVRGAGTATVVRVDDPHDRVAAVRAEMREEVEHTVLSPQAGVILPKESTKSSLLLVPLGAVIGAALLIPLAGIAFEGTSFAVRALWAGIIGATMGGTIAYIVGAALAIGGPAAQSAGHVGVPLRVEGDITPDVVRVLAEHQPMRVDVVTNEGTPVATLLTEEELSREGILERLGHQFTQNPHGDWSSARVENLPDLQARNLDMQHAANEEPVPAEDSRQASEKDAD
jgi:hypothetical protein